MKEDDLDSKYMDGTDKDKDKLEGLAAGYILEGTNVKFPQLQHPEKNRLPSKRTGYNQKAVIAGYTIYLRTGEYPDGTLGEIFVDMDKEGSLMSAWINSFCISFSVALQYGVPLSNYGDKFLFSKFEPAGVVQGHEDIKMCSSILDFIFRDLAINYLGMDDLKAENVEHAD